MRLSKVERLYFMLFFFIGTFILLVHFPESQTAGYAHKMQEKDNTFTKWDEVIERTEQLYEQAQSEGISSLQWNVTLRGMMNQENERKLLQWIEEELPGFERMQLKETNGPATEYHVKTILLKDLEQGLDHQIQLYQNPHKPKKYTKIIYTWSGKKMKQERSLVTKKLHLQLLHFMSDQYEAFASVEGRANQQYFDQVKREHFNEWIVDTWHGQTIEEISDQQYVSVTGWVPSWEQKLLSADHWFNVQLSARKNELTNETRVTIGYPLIIIEH